MPAKFAVSKQVRAVLKKATIEPRAVILNGPKLDPKLYREAGYSSPRMSATGSSTTRSFTRRSSAQ